MRRKHYALGAAILTVSAATMVFLSKAQNSGMQMPFSPAPTMPVRVEAPAMSEPDVTVAAVPPSAPAEAPGVVALAQTTPPNLEIPTATNAPSDTPFVWQGSTGNGPSWKGSGGNSANSDANSSAPSGGGGGGGSGGSNTPNSPQTLGKPTVLTNDNSPGDNPPPPKDDPINVATDTSTGGDTPDDAGSPGDTGPIGKGGPSSLVPPDTDYTGGEPDPINGPVGLASGPELESVTIDEPGPLSLLLVGALGLLVARHRAKRNAA